jgi:hypothetical protein
LRVAARLSPSEIERIGKMSHLSGGSATLTKRDDVKTVGGINKHATLINRINSQQLIRFVNYSAKTSIKHHQSLLKSSKNNGHKNFTKMSDVHTEVEQTLVVPLQKAMRKSRARLSPPFIPSLLV